MSTENPFTLVYDALWALVEKHPAFLELVKVGNRIKYNSSSVADPLKREILTADLPEVVIIGKTVSGNLLETSNSSKIVRVYELLASTGDWRYNQLLAQIEWQFFCSMANWRETLGALKWKEKAFVKRVNMTSGQQGASDPERNRNIVGWSAAWSLEIEMHFQTSELVGELK